jgi:hypothetical protein
MLGGPADGPESRDYMVGVGVVGAGALFVVLRRLTRFLVDFLAAPPLAARFLVDFFAAFRLVVFFLGDRVAVFFPAARFFVAISCGSFRFSARVTSLVYPLGAELGEETPS